MSSVVNLSIDLIEILALVVLSLIIICSPVMNVPVVCDKLISSLPVVSAFFAAYPIAPLARPLILVPKDPNEQIAKLESLGAKLSDYTGSAEIRAEIDAQVQELNKKFNNPEQVKKFTILPRDLNVDEGELTPTLKIRRKQINENWAKEIEAMYTE